MGTGDMTSWDSSSEVPWDSYADLIETVRIKSGVTSIGNCAFAYCNMKSITLPEGIKSIGANAFYGSVLSSITLPDSLRSIGPAAFMWCDKLLSIAIPDGVTCIQDNTFSRCLELKSVTLPDGITEIGDGAFYRCEQLVDINIPKNLVSIGDKAFHGSRLDRVIIPSSVTSIGWHALGYWNRDYDEPLPEDDRFKLTICGQKGTEAERYANDNGFTFVVYGICGDDAIFTYEADGLLVISGEGSMTNWNSTDKAPWYSNKSSVLSVEISDGITNIGNFAFRDCSELVSVSIADSVTSIGRRAFENCKALTEVVIPEGMTSIGANAFTSCVKLESITVPESVTSIGADALAGCDSLTIYGVAKSYAETYAKNNDIRFSAHPIGETHTFGDWTTVTEVTCTADGERIRSCTVCEETETETIPATGHSYEATVTEPTCTEGGYTTHTCTVCDDEYTDNEIKATGHSYKVVVFDATCVSDGVKTRICINCDVTENEIIPAMGHSYEATVTEPTCTEGGYTTHTCGNCGDTYTDSETEALGHGFGEWVVDVEPTVDAEGSRSRKCSRCEEVETESIPKLEVEESGAVFTLSSEKAMPGENVKLTLSLKSKELINSIAISELVFDSEVLEFVGFADYGHMEEKCSLPPVFDDELKCIVLALAEPEKFEGDICTLEFKVKEDVTDCTTTVSATPLTKLKGDVINSVLTDSEVEICTYLKGDIDGDEDVDIDDAVYLFCHSMLPSYYPMSYKGSLNIVPDGSIDVDDAVYLFNYSILPDIYPIG